MTDVNIKLHSSSLARGNECNGDAVSRRISQGPLPVVLAGVLRLALLIFRGRNGTVVWTAAIIIIAIYGLHVFDAEFAGH
jgi:hypothetical protein